MPTYAAPLPRSSAIDALHKNFLWQDRKEVFFFEKKNQKTFAFYGWRGISALTRYRLQ
jgi:hypothetical protein